MPTPSVAHSTFDIERSLAAPAARVFAAWSDAALKRSWNACHDDWRSEEHRLDFRVDSTELSRTVEPDGTAHTMKARFLDIVPDQRIVYVYEMTVNGRKISASLATFTIEKVGSKTKLVLTEQGTYFDDPDMAKYAPEGQAKGRLEGTKGLMDQLVALVQS